MPLTKLGVGATQLLQMQHFWTCSFWRIREVRTHEIGSVHVLY